MKASGGAFITPVYGADGRAYMSVCDAHGHGMVFPEKEQARACAERHNAAHHKGRAPHFRGYGFRDFNGDHLT